MTEINVPRFRRALADTLEASGAAPVDLEVERDARAPIIRVRWSMLHDEGPRELSLAEADVIASGGPVWVAALMSARKGRRREMRRSG